MRGVLLISVWSVKGLRSGRRFCPPARRLAEQAEQNQLVDVWAEFGPKVRLITPDALVIGPALATIMAQQAAVASFPVGAALGRLWYAAFPVAVSSGLIAAVAGGLMAASAVAAAFSGVVTDPIQRRIGLHRRRLLRLIVVVERQFKTSDKASFISRDHYIARLLSLLELVVSAVELPFVAEVGIFSIKPRHLGAGGLLQECAASHGPDRLRGRLRPCHCCRTPGRLKNL